MTAPALYIDFETRSVLDLKEVGLYSYANNVTTDAWCMSFAIGDEEPHTTIGEPGADGLLYPRRSAALDKALAHVEAGGEVVAHNAAFELAIWNSIMAPRYGWPVLRPEQTTCTMAAGFAMSLPGALEDIALALGLAVLKDAEGRALMLRMARPRSKKGVTPIVWWDEPEKVSRLVAYCEQDVRVEREVHKRVMPLSDTERRVWLLDQRINNRGVQVDVPAARAAVAMAEELKALNDAKIAELTGGRVQTIGALIPLKQWMREQGVAVDGLAKQDVVDLLDGPPLPAAVEQVLHLRQESAKASAAKFEKIVDMAGYDDGRLHNMYAYHAAGTGRWAGRGVQTHNLPRNMPKAKQVEQIIQLVLAGEHETIDAVFGPPLTLLSQCLRSFFIAEPDHVLIPGDFANVEGRGQAWFAGEQWKLDAFVAADNKTGPGLYELAYSRMFGVPVESVLNPSEERQIGKVAELAFGYQGGIGSFHTMGKNYNVRVSDAQAEEFKNAWRAAHPHIVQAWYDIQRAAISAVVKPGEVFKCGAAGRQASFKMVGSFLWLLLPSGRALCYPYPKVLQGAYGPQLTYMTQPSPEDIKKLKIIDDPKNSGRWMRIGTYGGSLFNNIVQGFCRDIEAHAMLAADSLGAKIVMHTHDEIIPEVHKDKAEGARAKMQEIMCTPPAWAAGFPLKAECNIMVRYGK